MQKNVLLVGHSFARRAAKLCPFKLGDVKLHANGVSGGGVKDLWRIWEDVHDVIKPDIVFIQSGENDIGSMPWKEIAEEIFLFAESISSETVKVVIGSKFKRYKFRKPSMTLYKYDRCRKQINIYLKRKCNESKTAARRIWFCAQFKLYEDEDRFLDDGVHLSPATELLWVKMITLYCNSRILNNSNSKCEFQ